MARSTSRRREAFDGALRRVYALSVPTLPFRIPLLRRSSVARARRDLAQVLPPAPVKTLEEVLTQLSALERALDKNDGLRFFNRLYAEVTRDLVARIKSGRIADPSFLTALDVAFANSYFEAVRQGDRGPDAAPPAWRPVFEARWDKRVAPIQFALGGMNAHINYDLPVGIVQTCIDLGIELRVGSPQHRDFEAINDVFATAQENAKKWLYKGPLRWLDRLLGRVDDAVALWNLRRAREAAWTNAVLLWKLRNDPPAAAASRDTLAHTVGGFGRGIMFPSTLAIPLLPR